MWFLTLMAGLSAHTPSANAGDPPPVGAPPIGTPPAAGMPPSPGTPPAPGAPPPLGAPPPGGTAAPLAGAPVPGGAQPPPGAGHVQRSNGITLQYVEASTDHPLTAPVMTLAIGGADPRSFPLGDDGQSGGDPAAGDGHWAANADVVVGTEMALALYDSRVAGEPLFRGTVTVAADDKNPEVRVMHDTDGFRLDDGIVSPPVPGAEGAGAPGGQGGDQSGGQGGPQQPGEGPQLGKGPGGEGAAGLPAGTTPTATQIGIAALGALVAAAVGAGGAWRLARAGARPMPLGRRRETRPFGLPGFPETPTAWIAPNEDAETLFAAAIAELAGWGHTLVLPRATSRVALNAAPIGTVWQLGVERPDPLDAARAARFNGLAALVVEGAGAIEAPVTGEKPGAVMDELVERGKIAMLFVLRADEPTPAGTTIVQFTRDGDDLVAGEVRVRRADGRWRLVV